MRPVNRWKAIRALRSNLVLLVAGCALILLAGLWRVAIAPSIKIVAGDFDTVYYYEGTDTEAVAGPGQAPLTQDVVEPIIVERRTASRPDLTTSTVSVVEVTTRVLDQGSRAEISTRKALFALDRKTGQLTGMDDVPARSGYFIVFPFDSPRTQVPYWNELTESTHPAEFHKEEKQKGKTFYLYRYSYGGSTLKAPAKGYPARVTGAELKSMLGQPGLLVGDSTELVPSYSASGRGELLVEPVMGTIASVSKVDESVSMTVEDPSSDFLLTRMLYRVAYDDTRNSTSNGVQFALEELSKYTLQFAYIPLGLLGLGIACVLVACFAGVKRYARREGLLEPVHSADGTLEHTDGPDESAATDEDDVTEPESPG
ncbi:MAG: porin PorA family protein [Actinomycetota bacterium]